MGDPAGKDRSLPPSLAILRRRLGVALAFSGGVALLSFSVPLFTMQVYDRVLTSRSTETLTALLVLTLVLVAGQAAMEAVRGRYLQRCAANFDADLVPHVLSRSARLCALNPTAGAARALPDAQKLRDFIGSAGMIALTDLPFAPLFLLICFVFHPWLGLTAALGMVLVAALALILNRANAQPTSKALRSTGAAAGMGSRIAGEAAALRALALSAPLSERHALAHRAASIDSLASSERLARAQSTSRGLRMALQVCITAVGALLVIRNEITPGMLLASSIIAGKALAPVDQSVANWKQFAAAREAWTRTTRLFSTIPEEKPRTHVAMVEGAVHLEGVAIPVPGTRRLAVSGATLSVGAGRMATITGANGAGKSLLLEAIAGVRPMQSGAITLDGTPLDQWNEANRAAQIGFLPQRVSLYPGTIAENIAGFADLDPALLEAAIELSNAARTIATLPDGLDTTVPDGTGNISAGLVRRIGVARAIYGWPAVLLLDEPMADLDADGRSAMAEVIRTFRDAGRTIIAVSSTPGILAMSDCGLVLANGRAHAANTREELMRMVSPQRRDRRAGPTRIADRAA